MKTQELKQDRRGPFTSVLAILAVAVTLGACDAGSFVEPDDGLGSEQIETGTGSLVASVDASTGAHTFTAPGETVQLTAVARDGSGATLGGVTLEWSSTDSSIVTVSSMGLVTAKTPGTAAIIVAALCCAAADTVAITVPSQAPAAPGALHPNEPAGMTVITNADGSVAYERPGGPAFGDAKWGNWWGNRGGEQNVELVDDPSNPTGSGKAVRLNWRAADGEAAKAVIDFESGYREIYIAMRVVKPKSWPTNPGNDSQPNALGHKWFYLLPENATTGSWGAGLWVTHGVTDTWSLWNDGTWISSERGALSAREPEEMLMEYLFIAESSQYAKDGRVTMWLDGQQVAHDEAIQMLDSGAQANGVSYDPLFRRLQLYAHANDVPADTHYDIREFFISGRK